ncbi:uncharacterized protein LOC124803185 [Schistocerca piceifrons]|uniref:uncharacterized protein LOC124803185 n=1 Tax=Schistocerca piceifrons TaxID=274613 RepID=UPI001F5F0598|nr:uncharacterized protein LOC124803185 [Schistocerca piceifrons]
MKSCNSVRENATECKVTGQSVCSNQLRIMSLNIQCLKNKYLELEVAANSDHIDCLCVMEHWCRDSELSSINLSQFKLASQYEAKSLIIEKDFEAVAIQLYSLKKKIIVAAIYRSPSGDTEVFLKNSEEMLNIFSNENSTIILCGDFNINLLVQSPVKNKFLDILKCCNMFPHISAPTRTTDSSESLIDNIFSNVDTHEVAVTNVNIGLSDHNALTFNLTATPKEEENKKEYKRFFSTENCNRFKNNLKNAVWSEVLAQTNTNDAYNIFASTFMTYFEMCFPKKLLSYRSSGSKGTWITPGIKKSSETMKLLSLKLKTCHDQQFVVYVRTYKKTYRKVIAKAKLLSNDRLIRQASNKSRMLWKMVKKETGGQTKEQEINLKNNENIPIKKDAMANYVNNYFVNIPLTLSSKFKQQPTVTTPMVNTSMMAMPTDEHEVLKVIKCLKSKMSYGLDDVPVSIIKKIAPCVVKPIVHIANLSLSIGHDLKLFIMSTYFCFLGNKFLYTTYILCFSMILYADFCAFWACKL